MTISEQLRTTVESMLIKAERPMVSLLPRKLPAPKSADKRVMELAAFAGLARTAWLQAELAEREANKAKRYAYDLLIEIESALHLCIERVENPPKYQFVDEHENTMGRSV